jgi:hypothetical protein
MPKRGWLKKAENMRIEGSRLAKGRDNLNLSMSSGRSAARKGGYRSTSRCPSDSSITLAMSIRRSIGMFAIYNSSDLI